MALVNLVEKKVRMELHDIVRFQILSHAFFQRIPLSDLELDCLTELGIRGEAELAEFCNFMSDVRLQKKLKEFEGSSEKRKPEASPQAIRNVLFKVEKKGLIVKEGVRRKKIALDPGVMLRSGGNILVRYNVYRIETEKS